MIRPFRALAAFAAEPFEHQSWPPKRRRVLLILLPLLGFTLVAVFRYVVSFAVTHSSDDASNLLAGMEMARGNWRLHGWILAPDNLASTDILGAAVLTAIFGPRPILMQGLEALIWAGIVILGISLAARWQRVRSGIVAALIALTLLALTVQQDNPDVIFMTVISSHASTILLALATFWLVSSIEARPDAAVAVPQLAALGVVLAAGSFADPLFLVVGALPTVATCLFRVRRAGRNTRLVAIVALTVCAVALARFLLGLNGSTGGFRSQSLSLGFAAFEDLPNHLLFALRSVARAMGADFSGRSLTKAVTGNAGQQIVWLQPLFEGPYIFVLRVPFVLAFLAVLWEGGVHLRRDIRAWPLPSTGTRCFQYLDQLLWTSSVLSMISAIVTTVIGDGSAIRFFLPATVTGSILIARRFASLRLFAAYAVLALAGSFASEVFWIAHGPMRPAIVSAEQLELVETLEKHGLERGYAGYWESSISTVVSNGRIKVLALVEDLPHHLAPFTWFVNLDWYREAAERWHGRVFFISEGTAKLPLAISQDAIVGMFGRPTEVLHSGDSVINVYDVKSGALAPLAPIPSSPPVTSTEGASLAKACGSVRLASTGGKGSLDVLSVQTGTVVMPAAPVVKLQDGDVLVARGWATDSLAKAPAAAMCIAVDGRVVSDAKVLYGQFRPDVAAAFHNPALAATGYEISLPAEQIGRGPHRLQLFAVTAGHKTASLFASVGVTGPQTRP